MNDYRPYEARSWPCSRCMAVDLYEIRRALCKPCYMALFARKELPARPTVDDLLIKWRRVDPSTQCWEWLGSIGTDGYGGINGSYVHRVSYMKKKGPIPPGMQIDHLCRNRRCFNPEHLEAVTGRVNILRGMSVAAIVARTNICMRGHEFTPENTYITPDGTRRQCRACQQIRERRKTAKKQAVRLSLSQKQDAS